MDEVDIETAAAMMGRSPKTLRRYLRSGRIDAHLRGGKYMFSVDDIDKLRAKGMPWDNQSISERLELVVAHLETLDKRISAISERVEKLEQTSPMPTHVMPSVAIPTRPSALRKTSLVHDGGGLPDGLVSFRSFADRHSIAQTTAQKAIDSGRLPVTRGRWKSGGTYVKMALDPGQQRRFCELFASNPGWKDCPDCPHTV